MAVDTRNKRASVLGVALAALVVLPAPDAAVAQADRQQVVQTYAGLSAGAAVAPVIGVRLTLSDAAVTTLTASDALRATTLTASDAAVTTLTPSDILVES